MTLSMAALLLTTAAGAAGLYARHLADIHYAKSVTFPDSIVGRTEAKTGRRCHVVAACLLAAAIVIGATSIVLRIGAAL